MQSLHVFLSAFLLAGGAAGLLQDYYSYTDGLQDYPGSYCLTGGAGGSKLCCEGRQDDCGMRHGSGRMATRCYCDKFCPRSHPRPHLPDCCPDFAEACLNRSRPAPPPAPVLRCYYKGQYHSPDAEFMDNCKICQCKYMEQHMEVLCTPRACLVDPELMEAVNRAGRGWSAGNVTAFWGRALEDGMDGMLGTDFSSRKVRMMPAIRSHARKSELPRAFDWRQSGVGTAVADQAWCNASWSFAIVGVFGDRLAKWSGGNQTDGLSFQQHRTCVRGQRRSSVCSPGYLTKGWKYLMNTGLTTERCYPPSENTRCELTERRLAQKTEVRCPAGGGTGKLYKASALSRLSGEADIMKEILDAGPVIATLRVFPELFMYKGGVYECPTKSPKAGRLHAVRIVGWGEDFVNWRLTPYWIVGNSWGTEWGERGFLRIRRGRNDCDIEEFVLAFYSNSKRLRRQSSRPEDERAGS